MLFQILAIILAIAFGVCIVAFIRQLYKSHSRGHLSKYLKTWKKDNRILLRSMVSNSYIMTLSNLLILTFIVVLNIIILVSEASDWLPVLSLLLTFVPYVLCSVWAAPQAPGHILLTSDGLIIAHNKIEDMLPYADIKNIQIAEPGRPKHRTLGTIGIFGYFGKWEDEKYGEYIACFGKRNKCFLVTTETGLKYMLGCNHPDEVVTFVRKRLKQSKPKC